MNDAFACQRCGACCRLEGQVRLTPDDITRLAAFLGLDEPAFIQQYAQISRDRRGLVLQDGAGDACVFLTNEGCAVHPAKPSQCAAFPQTWHNPGWEQSCQARRSTSNNSPNS